jgi:hypothetical protein
LIGLTDAGRLVSPETLTPPDLSEVATFRATNMGGSQAICPMFRDGSFGMSREQPDANGQARALFFAYDGVFSRAFCAWEGFAVGVRRDGSVWYPRRPLFSGNDWVDVAFSVQIFCALNESGVISCVSPEMNCETTRQTPCAGPALPNFADRHYRSLSATAAAACAISEQGELVCQRYDGLPLLTDPGPYTFLEAGAAVVCAIRVDGSVACFRHGGDGPFAIADPGAFTPIAPLHDSNW